MKRLLSMTYSIQQSTFSVFIFPQIAAASKCQSPTPILIIPWIQMSRSHKMSQVEISNHPVLQRKETRPREVEWLFQGHKLSCDIAKTRLPSSECAVTLLALRALAPPFCTDCVLKEEPESAFPVVPLIALNQRYSPAAFRPPGDVWQCLETF